MQVPLRPPTHVPGSLVLAFYLRVAEALSPPALWDWEAGQDVEHSSEATGRGQGGVGVSAWVR